MVVFIAYSLRRQDQPAKEGGEVEAALLVLVSFLDKEEVTHPLKPVFHPRSTPTHAQAKFWLNYERNTFILCDTPSLTYEY